MRNFISLLVFLFLVVHVNGADPAAAKINSNQKTDEPVDISPNIDESVIQKTYPNGQLMSEFTYYKGKLNGISRDYYKSGQVMYEWNYLNDVLHGVSKSYYINGALRTRWGYKKGLLHGKEKHYYKKGKIKKIIVYKHGKKIQSKSYDKWGKLIAKINFPSVPPKK